MPTSAKRVTVRMQNVRSSYLQVFTPGHDATGKDMGHSGHFIFPENHPDLPALMNAIVEVGKDFWKDKWDDVLVELKGKDRLCLHRGDVSKAGQAPYKGMLYVSAGNPVKPRTLDQNNREVNAADGVLYSGCYVDVILTIKAAAHPQGGKRVSANLDGVRKRADGERLSGGRVASAEEFGAPVEGAAVDAPAPGGTAISGLI